MATMRATPVLVRHRTQFRLVLPAKLPANDVNKKRTSGSAESQATLRGLHNNDEHSARRYTDVDETPLSKIFVASLARFRSVTSQTPMRGVVAREVVA
ncbi:hypothetical protein [Marisediminicola antarctica]|uniref:hypothetical protein n=1 Tax=Marisediminicola antarctica TaxID=674079 RepID=UPI0013794542|nr:hypothetical protein [Marisediminicola antarctica]